VPADIDANRRRLRQTLESLRSAGLEWLPRQPPAAPSQEDASVPQDLFAEPEDRPAGALSPARRRQELATLAETVSGCTRCKELASTRTQTVFGVGPLDADVCFVGEAPGADEDRQGEPFVGAAGKLLDRIIVACGFQRNEVYICNIIKCRPPGNRTPKPDEAANCSEYLSSQLALARPKYMVALGSTAAGNLLGVTTPLGKLRGRFHDFMGIPLIVTYHPAFLLPHRAPERKKDVWEDMKMLLKKMGRPIPTSNKE